MLGGCQESDGAGALDLKPAKGKTLLADGKSLTSGRVAFVLPGKAMEFSGELRFDGSYRLGPAARPGAPGGAYRVRIDPEPVKTAPSRGKAARRADFPFPEKSVDETTSVLNATMKPGENTIEPFQLVPGLTAGAFKGPRKSDRD